MEPGDASQADTVQDAVQSNPTVRTPFPDPSSFWTSFTASNLSAYEALEAKAAAGALPATFELPTELHNLRPPTPPASGEYRAFGEGRSLTAPLTSLPPETPSLLPPQLNGIPTPQHLLNLTRSLLLSYLELIHVLSVNPEGLVWGPKWEDLRDLFRNVYHALNMYRPWQAKEALIHLLEETRDRAKREIKGVEELKKKVDGVLKGLEGLGDDEDRDRMDGIEMEANHVNGTGTNGVKFTHEEAEREKMLWDIYREELED